MEVREKEILLGSDRLFRKKGFKQVTMDDIARDLAMSKKTVYKYFDNKKDLILSNIRHQIQHEKDQLCTLEESSNDAIGEMMHLIKHVIKMFDHTNPMLYEDLKKYYPESWKVLDGFMSDHIYNRIFNNVERGIDEGLYRDDIDADIMAKMYVAKVRSMMEESIFPKRKYKHKQLLGILIEYHIRGISSEKGVAIFENYKLMD